MRMLSSTQTSIHQFVFDDIIVDCENFQVRKAGEPLSLTPRAFDVLVFLIENHGRVVEKTQLFEHVWKEQFVSDNALSRAIKEVRHALGDSADNPRYIETVPRRGYRFVAPLSSPESVEAETNNFSSDWSKQRGAPESLAAVDGSDSSASEPQKTSRFFNRKPWLFVLIGLLAVLTTGMLALSLRKSAAGPVKPSLVRSAQITTWTGLDIFPTISPDGNMVAYSSDHNGPFEIYSRALTTGARENQLTSDGQQNLEPSWSPDGKWIAYYSQSKGGIWVMPAGGGVARQLVEFGSRPAWSPDGTRIAFQSDGLTDISNTSANAPSSTIWIVSSQGGEAYPLTYAGNPLGGHGSPTWSADGKHLAFVCNNILTSTVWTVSPSGTDLKQLTPKGRDFFDPVYSPDGQNLYVITGGVWRIPLSAAGEPLGEPEQVANPTQALVRSLSFSADGKRVVSSLMRQRGNLWSVSLSKLGEPVGVPAPFFEDTSQRKTNPMFSKDGSKVAYNVWIAGEAGSVWTVGANGKDRAQLTTEPSAIVGWLPDGSQLASIAFREGGRFLTTTAIDTGRTKTITQLMKQVPFCRLSPDGKTIAFNAHGDRDVNIWLYSIDSGTVKQITFDKELFGFPSWSPDGKWIAGELKRKDDTYVAIVPVDGGTPVALNSDRGQSWTGSWSPDGDKIAFASSRNGVWNVWWISRTTKEQKQLTTYTKPNSFVRYPTWSPRGDQIVYEYAELTGNIWLAELK